MSKTLEQVLSDVENVTWGDAEQFTAEEVMVVMTALEEAQAEIRRQRDRADQAEARVAKITRMVVADNSPTAHRVVQALAIKATA